MFFVPDDSDKKEEEETAEPGSSQNLMEPRQGTSQQTGPTSQELVNIEDETHFGAGESTSDNFLPITVSPSMFDTTESLPFFENSSLKLSITKSRYKRGHKFSLVDSLFRIQIIPKKDSSSPIYLKDLLDVLDTGLKYIVTKLQNYFPDNPDALSYLTLYQKGMVNGLSTGGYSLSKSQDLVDKLLQMLSSFLISNANVTVNDEFNIYVDVYSKDHSNSKKKMRNIYQGRKPKNQSKNFWAIDLQESDCLPSEYLNDKCLLTSIVLGHLQNCLLEKNDKRYDYAKKILEKSPRKCHHAFNTVKDTVDLCLDYLKGENVFDYCNLDQVAPVVHTALNCQIIIFSGFDNTIRYMYPETFDESLRPIFLFDSDDNTNHIIFIKNLRSFFNASKLKTCLFCKTTFKTLNQDHQCSIRPTCRSCKRHFSVDEKSPCQFFKDYFCGKTLSEDLTDKFCKVCKSKPLSKQCALLHSKVCGKVGRLGYQCPKCNKFIFTTKRQKNAKEIKINHSCDEKFCKLCKKYHNEEHNHLCKLHEVNFNNFANQATQLGFLTMEFLTESESSPVSDEVPNMIILYKENKPLSGVFDSFTLNDFNKEVITTLSAFSQNYCDSEGKLQRPLGQTKKVAKMLHHKLNQAQAKNSQQSLLDKLVGLITQWRSVTLICSDENGFIFNAFIRGFLQANINVKILSRGKKFFSCEIPELNIKLLNSTNYLPGNEYEIARISNFSFDQIFFPLKLNKPTHYNYTGKVPSLEAFTLYSDTSELLKKKTEYVENFSEIWDFKQQLFLYSNQKCLLLCSSLCLFLKETISLQHLIHEQVSPDNPNRNQILWPFSGTLCTFSGFIYSLFKGLFLREENIFIVKNEYCVPSRKVSHCEYEFCRFLEFLYPDLDIVHNYSNPNGQKYFEEAVPDIYIPSLKCAVFMNGCYFHGHYVSSQNEEPEKTNFSEEGFDIIKDETPNQKSCIGSKPATSDKINKRLDASYEKVQDDFWQKTLKLSQNNSSDIIEVKVFWECFFNHKLKQTQKYLAFRETFKKRPLERLIPRSLCKGGFVQPFALSWSQSQFPNETFYCCDINGLYSHVAISESYNVGKYEVLIGKSLTKIKVKNEKFFIEGRKLYGTMQVTILPPKKLSFPFLICQMKERSVLTLCKKCSDNMMMRKCKHQNKDREFFGSYFIEELEFALTLGYQISAIHECHAYPEQKPIFKAFVSILNYNKIKNSSYLSCSSSEQERKNYCELLNKKMNLSPPFALKTNDEPNSYKKFLFKQAANSFFGKFQQRRDKVSTILVGDDDELGKLISKNHSQVQSIDCFEDKICQVTLKPENSYVKDSLHHNCYLGGQIVAFARIFFYKQVQKITQLPTQKLFYCDTDSIFFSLPKSSQNPLPMSDATGDFKYVYENVQSFYCLGPKNYTISFFKEQQLQASTKVRGLNLNSLNLKEALNSTVYTQFLRSMVRKEALQIKIPQVRTRKTESKPYSKKTRLEMITFSNKILSQRIVNTKSPFLETFPFGF